MELLPLGPVLFIDTAGIDDRARWATSGCEDPAGVRPHRRGHARGRRRPLGSVRGRNLPRVAEPEAFPSSSPSTRSDLAKPQAASLEELVQAQRHRLWKRSPARGAACWSCARRWCRRRRGFPPPAGAGGRPGAAGRDGRAGGAHRHGSAQGPADRARRCRRSATCWTATPIAWWSRSGSCATPWAGSNRPPALVVTDSQAFLKVAADTPPAVKMTSFSILFARQKGDLCQFVEGALAIERLRPGDRVLVAEACTHHPIGDDIGRVKIPRWLTQYVGGELRIDTTQGHDFPADLSEYRLVVHCGACMWNRREMLTRLGPLPPGRRADLQLRPDDRLHAGDLRPGAGPFPRRAGDVPQREDFSWCRRPACADGCRRDACTTMTCQRQPAFKTLCFTPPRCTPTSGATLGRAVRGAPAGRGRRGHGAWRG